MLLSVSYVCVHYLIGCQLGRHLFFAFLHFWMPRWQQPHSWLSVQRSRHSCPKWYLSDRRTHTEVEMMCSIFLNRSHFSFICEIFFSNAILMSFTELPTFLPFICQCTIPQCWTNTLFLILLYFGKVKLNVDRSSAVSWGWNPQEHWSRVKTRLGKPLVAG